MDGQPAAGGVKAPPLPPEPRCRVRGMNLRRRLRRASHSPSGFVRTQGSNVPPIEPVSPSRYAALTSSINSRHREINSSRRADDDAGVGSISTHGSSAEC